MSGCQPYWQTPTLSSCPFGRGLIGDVTLPNGLSVGDALCVGYSYLPYVIFLAGLVAFLIHRGTRTVLFVTFPLLIVGLGELCWKHLANQARPLGTCLVSCGMPSSHSAIAIGWLTWLSLEILFERLANASASSATTPKPMEMDFEAPPSPLNPGIPTSPSRVVPPASSPLSPAHQNEMVRRGVKITILLLLLLPIPPCRVVLRDHSYAQVLVGCAIGFVEALLWYTALNTFMPRCFDCIAERPCCSRSSSCARHVQWKFDYIPNHYRASHVQTQSTRMAG